MLEINGIAHIQLAVSRFEQCVPFYERLLGFLGLRQVHKNEQFLYYVGGRTAVAIAPVPPEFEEDEFDERRVGLHHACFRARSRRDVDQVYQFALELGAEIVYPAREGPWAPGYYSCSFLDPCGIRLEVNYVPGQGVLAEGVEFNPGTGSSNP